LISGQPDELPTSIANVREGERQANRPPGTTRILLWTTVAVDEDRDAARAAVRGSVARRALNSYSRLAKQNLLNEEDAEALQRLQQTHDGGHVWEDGYASLVPERWIDTFAIAGTPHEVQARLRRAMDSGAQEISMILMAPRSGQRGGADQMTYFAETVLQPLRQGQQATV
jgi:alkanesulfonate monooxygenase SsuD/methylene tetrahydromethanopterin reductase-like flavin-dependent oxidoreductase (luciferase family)